MHIKHMHCMIEDLAEYGKCMIEAGTGNGNVNLCEAGQIVDMIKDLADAEYHSLISKEMKKAEEEEEEEEKYLLKMLKEEHGMSDDESKRYYNMWRYKSGRFAPKGRGTRRGYEEPPYYHMTPDMMKEHDPEYWRDLDRHEGRLYYSETMPHMTRTSDIGRMDGMRDHREGKSGQSRRTYMEKKEMHKSNTPEDKQAKMHELEKYTKELAEDVTEMIADATPEERSLLKQKMQVLIQKIG